MRSDSAVRLVRRSETAPRPREWGADVRTLFAGGAEGVPGQKHAGNTVGEHAGNEVGERGGNEVGEHAGNKVGEHVGSRVGEHAGNKVGEHVGSRVGEHAGNKVGEHVGSRVGEHAGNKVGEHAGSRVGEHAENKVGKHARNRVGWRPWQVLGGPGTGKTALLIDVAVDRIAAGADPESVLVLTHSKAAALRVRGAVTRQLSASIGGVPGATREPLVRTVHSYAFALLRTHAAAHGNPPPRLLTGTEQDVVLREMLRGEVEDIARGAEELWPQRLQPGLGTVGFAEQLRDLMLRATERGLGPEDLVELGRLHDRPEWEAAGRFAERYEQAMLLRWSVGVEAPEASAPALDAAELVGAALDALALDPRLLDGERDRIRYLLVDDAQHLDPLAAQLIRAIGGGAATVVIAGDPDQAVFTFRGADSRFAADPDAPHERRIILRDNHRCAPAVREAVARVAARLPGSFPHRSQVGAPDENDGAGVDFAVRVLTTPAKEAALIADRLRRAHLTDGVPWSRMAVVVRSVPLSLAPLRRALLAAGVPVLQPKPDVPLARRRGASWMLLTLRALLSGERGGAEIIGSTTFTADDALDLLSGPLGGADQISLRRLRRGIRRTLLERGRGSAETDPRDGGDTPTDADRHDETADRRARRSSALDDEFGVDTVDSARFADLDRSSAEVLRDLIAGVGDFTILDRLTEVEAAPLRRVLKAIGRARRARTRGAGLEDVLWALWTASRLEKRWVGQSERGGAVGMQADRDLDAAVGLFDAAAAYVDRLPRATVEGFVEYLEQQEIPQDSAPLTDSGDAVAIVSAHAAAGREWDVVAIAGVQEGIWPNLRPRGTLLGVEDLVDLMAGVADPGEQVSRAAPILAEERRLLLLACSRARRSLLVTAVESVSGDRDLVPSRFLAELDPTAEPGEPGRIPPPIDPGRALVMQALIAELRGVACDPEDVPVRRERAARQLARLARAGVRGAHPDDWYGTAAPSSQLPLWGDEEGPVALSPSTVELLKTCPLRWALERHGGSDGDNPHAVKGNLVHTLVQALAGQVTEAQVKAALVRAWKAIDPASGDTGPQSWHSRQELRRTESMLDTFLAWLRNTRDELTQMGVEVPVDCVLPARDPDEYPVRIRGRVDRVERDALGRFVIVDVKTGKTPISKQAAQDHAQLATYQVAAAAGALDDDSPAATPGGARLIYVAKPNTREGATQRLQPPLDPEALTEWRTTIHTAATSTRGPSYLAMRNDGCRHCPVSTSCPVQDTGRQVTDE
uniref:PD-(D/E)XK nuclease family protein n=1 Tax=Nocardia terpenica TaxID=455432 RepID=UPI0020A62113|nr:PD-(D/E)XK nuclease family protein [Nocardia terpenica]